jgi:hypothetical protein
MVAITWVVRATGSSPVYVSGSTVRLRTDDTNVADLTNSVPIPAAGFNYSYWAHIALAMAGDAGYTQISNIRHYTDTTAWNTGSGDLQRGNMDAGDKGCATGSYDEASGTPGTTGDSIGASHAIYSGQTAKTGSLGVDTSAAPATIDSVAHATPATADYSKFIVIQVKVGTNATSGAQTARTNTWKWDEI